MWNKFEFYTPLNGGDGFKRLYPVVLMRDEAAGFYEAGSRYVMAYDQVHTLCDVRPGTVLLLHQYRDVLGPHRQA